MSLVAAPCPGLNLRVREGVEKGGAGGREGEGPLILTQNSKMSSLVRARSLLSKLNTRLARGLASEPPWLTSSKLKGQNHVGSFFRSRRGGATQNKVIAR